MLPLTAFGKNDIRGIYGEDVTEEVFFYTGRAFIKYVANKSGELNPNIWVTVCRDARTHSPSLVQALIKGIRSTGANVVDLGLAPTPIGYYSEAAGVPRFLTNDKPILGALIVTASHNPSQYNGLKMTYNKQSLNEEQIKEVRAIAESEYRIQSATIVNGELKEYDIIPDYIKELQGEFSSLARIIQGNIKIVVDSGNGTGGVVGPQLYRDLGCKVVELYSTPDGRFPNHHPNPSDPKNLEDLKRAVIT